MLSLGGLDGMYLFCGGRGAGRGTAGNFESVSTEGDVSFSRLRGGELALFVRLFVCASVHLSIYLSICLAVYLSICLSYLFR